MLPEATADVIAKAFCDFGEQEAQDICETIIQVPPEVIGRYASDAVIGMLGGDGYGGLDAVRTSRYQQGAYSC